jgi:uncharacterized protein
MLGFQPKGGKIMRKVWFPNLLSIIIVLMLGGCVFLSEPPKVSDDPIQISLIEGSGGTAYSILANGIAYSVETSYPDSIVSIVLGNPSDNPIRVNNYSADFALTSSASAFNSYKGINGFPLSTNIRVVATFNKSVLQFAINNKHGVKTFDEFITQKPKVRLRVPLGSSIGVMFDQMLAEYNLTRADLEAAGMEFLDVEQSSIAEMISQGYLDGYFTSSSVPASLITQTFSGTSMELISFSPQLLQSMNTKHGYTKSTIQKSAYSFLTADVPSLATHVLLIANDKVSDEVVYKLSKALNENLDYIRTIMADLREFESKSYVESFNIPAHPGATKYYEEIGIDLP